jgi:hypothetical protein
MNIFSFKVEQQYTDPDVKMRKDMKDDIDFMFPEKSFKEKEKPILYLIKSCENC